MLYSPCRVFHDATYLPYERDVNAANYYLSRIRWTVLRLVLLPLTAALLAACEPSPTMHVIGYLIEECLGGPVEPALSVAGGSLSGQVLFAGEPVAGASVLIATRTGTPYAARTDGSGHYRIDNIPLVSTCPRLLPPPSPRPPSAAHSASHIQSLYGPAKRPWRPPSRCAGNGPSLCPLPCQRRPISGLANRLQ